MTTSPVRIEYAIRRLNWRRTHYGILLMPGSTPIGALPTLEEAEADRARREAEVRAKVNPFLCGSTHAMRSHLPEAVFHDWLRDVGLEPPAIMASLQYDWPGWWTAQLPSLTAEQVAHVWNGLNRVRFFEIAPRPVNSVGYAVVRIWWESCDRLESPSPVPAWLWDEPGTEGGRPVKLFSQRADAETCRRKLEEEERRDWIHQPDDDSPRRFIMNRWTSDSEWPFGVIPGRPPNVAFVHGDKAPFFELAEIEVPTDAKLPSPAYLVIRATWSVEPTGDDTRVGQEWFGVVSEGWRGVPVAAFATRNEAEARTRELELEAARLFTPLQMWLCTPPSWVTDQVAAIVSLFPDKLREPDASVKAWTAWWEENSPGWSDDVLLAVWRLLVYDEYNLWVYSVREVECE